MLRHDHCLAVNSQRRAKQKVKSTNSSVLSHDYKALQLARAEARKLVEPVLALDEELRWLKSRLYRLNKLEKAAGSSSVPPSPSTTPTLSSAAHAKPVSTPQDAKTLYTPTWEKRCVWAKTEQLDLSEIVSHCKETRELVWQTEDRGLVTMSESVPMTTEELIGYIGRWGSHEVSNEVDSLF